MIVIGEWNMTTSNWDVSPEENTCLTCTRLGFNPQNNIMTPKMQNILKILYDAIKKKIHTLMQELGGYISLEEYQ